MTNTAPLPATILTGFLGSGKTTVLNHLLRTATHSRIGVLVNEFGAIDIDSSLLAAGCPVGVGVVELANGCICCTINDTLREGVAAMITRRADLDALVVETTGVADPAPVLATLRLPQFAAALRVDAVVCVVDVASVARSIGSAPAFEPPGLRYDGASTASCFLQQLTAADLIVANKRDLLVSPPALVRVAAYLNAAAPQACVLTCAHG